MYIKLGKTAINYVANTNDFMIVSELIDSGLSYENPVLVRSVNELDIWFTQDFEERDYLVELLNMGLTLYLYKPISTEVSTSFPDQINYDNYVWVTFFNFKTDTEINPVPQAFLSYITELKENNNLKFRIKNETGFSYYKWNQSIEDFVILSAKEEPNYTEWILGSEIPVINLSSINIHENLKTIKSRDDIKIEVQSTGGGTETYVWFDNQFVSTSLLPQNLENNSNSLNLRSTLVVNSENDKIPYTNPEYMTGEYELGIYSTEGKKWENYIANVNSSFDRSRITKEYQTLVFDLVIPQLLDNEYIIVPKETEIGVLIYRSLSTQKRNEVRGNYSSEIRVTSIGQQLLNEVKLGLIRNGFNVGEIEITENTIKDIYRINSSNEIISMPVTEFTNSKNIKFKVNRIANEAILFNTSKNNRGIEFWSRTIGGIKNYDIDGIIKVKIEEIEENYYRLTISRYDYSEVFEGYTTGVFGEERIDFKITNQSKLVYCNLYNKKLIPGTYELLGGEIETSTPEMWQKGISCIFDEDVDNVFPDFYFIPNIQSYTNLDEAEKNDINFLPIYKTFLTYASRSSCQFLIQNSNISLEETFGYSLEKSVPTTPYKPNTVYEWGTNNFLVTNENGLNITGTAKGKTILNGWRTGNEYYLNYTKDTSNYLIYFFREMSILGTETIRPGYYAFLLGLLTNQYAISSNVISYDQPSNNPYITEDIEIALQRYKSNYLVCNNQEYYYKKYLNGDDYVMTLWMRFTVGRIFRELQKNKWNFLSLKFNGQMERTIETILQAIVDNFSIVRSINLTDFVKNEPKNMLTISIDTYVNDLANNNLNLDITLNYSNINNQ